MGAALLNEVTPPSLSPPPSIVVVTPPLSLPLLSSPLPSAVSAYRGHTAPPATAPPATALAPSGHPAGKGDLGKSKNSSRLFFRVPVLNHGLVSNRGLESRHGPILRCGPVLRRGLVSSCGTVSSRGPVSTYSPVSSRATASSRGPASLLGAPSFLSSVWSHPSQPACDIVPFWLVIMICVCGDVDVEPMSSRDK